MDYKEQQMKRTELNSLMANEDEFFRVFGSLDDTVYSDGAISKKHKELMGLAISVATRCNECISYHIGGCKDNHASKQEMLEAIKIGVIAGGSITYPNARFAFSVLRELNLF
ncbi:carboxymuconolactone decarboxylase family protein [Lachnospiraceae bacterium OttesenSCG-928-D06]|nr:carboxymuconolactone decarboxylase family protein [Lachnospiraceae bacterium OttesenSCG-928-D06]